LSTNTAASCYHGGDGTLVQFSFNKKIKLSERKIRKKGTNSNRIVIEKESNKATIDRERERETQRESRSRNKL